MGYFFFYPANKQDNVFADRWDNGSETRNLLVALGLNEEMEENIHQKPDGGDGWQQIANIVSSTMFNIGYLIAEFINHFAINITSNTDDVDVKTMLEALGADEEGGRGRTGVSGTASGIETGG